MGQLAPLLFTTVVLLVVLLPLMAFAKRQQNRMNLGGQGIKIHGRLPIDLRRSFLVVGVGNRRWLVGATEQHIDPIAELSPEDWREPEAQGEEENQKLETPEIFKLAKARWPWLGLILGFFLLFVAPAHAVPSTSTLINSFDLRTPIAAPGLSTPLQLVFVMASLTLLPFIVMMTTSFIRSVIVLSFLRTAMGTQGVPPTPVMIGIALFVTMFTMAPVWGTIDKDALQPYLSHSIAQDVAFNRAVVPVHDFMSRQTNQAELAFFLRLSKTPVPATVQDVPIHVLIPAFMVSELGTAFKIGFLIYIPFLVIDLVVANILMALGMSMLPPQMISTAFKILIFTLANGWHLIIQAIVQSFR